MMLDWAEQKAWDVATRYHEFKIHPSMQKQLRELRRVSADAVLDRAQEILGSVVHPKIKKLKPLDELPPDAEDTEFDVEETIEAVSPIELRKGLLEARDMMMEYSEPRRQPLVITVDTSLSMTGEKLALTAVAIAVVLLQFPNDPLGIVAFENEAQILKFPDEKITVRQLVERFLDVPAQGYTHLEDGLKAALDLMSMRSLRSGGRPVSTVLLTDGKYTAGKDPGYLGSRFAHLVVLKMGRERASLALCTELAQLGKGTLKEVPELEALPSIMYTVVKDLLRGRS